MTQSRILHHINKHEISLLMTFGQSIGQNLVIKIRTIIAAYEPGG